MYNVSNDLKLAVRDDALTTDVNLTVHNTDGTTTLITGDNVKSLKITDNCYSDGVIIGTAMSKEAEIMIINDDYDLEDKVIDIEVGVMIDRVYEVMEYIPYGSFIVKSYEDTKSNNTYKVIAYDFMDKLNVTFVDNNTYPTTLQDFYETLATQYGLEVETQTLPNQSFSITEAPYFENMSGRVVLGAIAEMFGSFAKINRENKIQMYLTNTTTEQFSRADMNSTLEIDKKYGPVNSLSLRLANVEGENVTREDTDSIALYGETAIVIEDNPFVYTQALRETVIDNIFNRIKGFEYIPTTFNTKALLYMDCGDTFEAQQMANDTYVSSIILNQYIQVPNTRQCKSENKALTNTGITNKYKSTVDQRIQRTEIMVDKANGTITSIASKVEDNTTNLTQVTQQANNLTIQTQQLATSVSNLESDIDDVSNSLADMSFNFSTKGLAIGSSLDANNSLLDNTGIRVYNYDTLQAIFNYKGSGIDKLIVTGTAQIGYLRFIKSTKNSEKVTKIYHLDQLIENLEDLEV